MAVQVWCDWLLGNNDTWYPLVSSEPFAQLAQLATRLETVKDQVTFSKFFSRFHFVSLVRSVIFWASVSLRRHSSLILKLVGMSFV